MPDPRGFLTTVRVPDPQRHPRERVDDHREVFTLLPWENVREQAGRCMGCGIPFCHQGCPLGNLIPEWNDLVRTDRWRQAVDRLHATNDFPEFTGFTCPAPCEPACVLEINDDPVMIKQVELAIIERAFEEGWVQPRSPHRRTGRRVAVVGSGPAGLAAANQINQAGHSVVVYERDEAVGGLLRFGIPDFKLEKRFIDRRVDILAAEGIEFRCNVDVGVDLSADELEATHDAVVLAVGSRSANPLEVPGTDLGGVHDAMHYLYQRNRSVAGELSGAAQQTEHPITAANKRLVVIGGGDTAADCVASAHREKAASVTQIDRYPEPAGTRPRELTDWPRYPKRLPSTYALDEGGRRTFNEEVQSLSGEEGHVAAVHGRLVAGPPDFAPVPGTGFSRPADLVLVAIGFGGPEPAALLRDLDIDRDAGGNIAAPEYLTSVPGVFAAGDARRGQSLVVWAIDEGRRCAAAVNEMLHTEPAPARGRR
jgi:glutamate synthase (NADPH/NADH) small chain